MSLDLYYRRPPVPTPELQADRQVKYLLGPLLWGHDGTLAGEPVTLRKGDYTCTYLRGYADALSRDAEMRVDIEAILAIADEHGAVEVWIGD